MTVLVEYTPVYLEHDAGPGHPEHPGRVQACVDGITDALPAGAFEIVEPRRATIEELALVHERGYVEAMQRFCERGGGWVDLDTHAGGGSWDAALYAAGAGLDAIDREQPAFCAVRPPGHHATSGKGMGFCLFNNVAVVTAALAERGERVVIVDWDVHHGNGTQDIFYADDRVLYTSMHQWPLYPGTGRIEERGEGPGEGTTLNFPLPPGATGDVHLAAMDLVMEVAAEFEPTWVLVSSGFDAHRDDVLDETALGLTSGDFAALCRRAVALAPANRCVVFLEGGYHAGALASSSAACVAVLAGLDDFEPAEAPTTGGPGMNAVDAVKRLLASS